MVLNRAENDRRQLVVFTGQYASTSTVEHLEAVVDRFPNCEVAVFQQFPRKSRKAWLRGKWRQWRREPVSYPLELLAQLPSLFNGPSRRRSGAAVDMPQTLADFCKERQIAYHACRSLHAAETIQAVRALRPWLGIALSAPILRRKLFAIPTRGTINLHKSFLPDYRGLPPGFWELRDGARESGASVHWVDDALDTGAVIHQRRLAIPLYSTPRGLSTELDQLGTDVLVEAIAALLGGRETDQPQRNGSAPNRSPAWLERRRVEMQCAENRRCAAARSPMLRRWAKGLVLGAYAFAWAPLRNAVRSCMGRSRTTVLLYHRVSDAFVDSVTVGVEQFMQQLGLLRSRYQVVDMETFLASRGKPSRRHRVVITFDDGYQDNLLAARLLRRYGLPATFFLSTGMIGTDEPFPHDLKRLGRRVPALDWHEVQQMARWGFAFSNHTVHHIDCGAVPVEAALGEIRAARSELQQHLGDSRVTRGFAFPYGLPHNMTDQLRQALPGEGIEFCCSARGGTNGVDFDVLDIRRCGLDANFSPVAFRALVEGWQTAR